MSVAAITMPRWGLTMDEGTLTAWLIAEGADVTAGAEIAEIETTKLAGVVEAPATGVFRKALVQPGETAPVGALLGMIAGAAVPDDELDRFAAAFAVAESKQEETNRAGPQQIELDGRKLSYIRMGSGATPVLLIHGFGGDAQSWSYIQDALAATTDIIALDLPGHGASSKEIIHGSLRDQAGLLAAFMDALGIARAHLVGHSMGGGIALALAAAKPARVASVTALAPLGLGATLNQDYLDAFVAAQRRRDVETALRMLFHDQTLATQALAEAVVSYKRVDGVTEALSALRGALSDRGRQREDLSAVLDGAVPVHVLAGAHDRIVPPPAPGDRVTILPDVGHMPHVEAPEAVLAAIRHSLQAAAL